MRGEKLNVNGEELDCHDIRGMSRNDNFFLPLTPSRGGQ